MRKQVHLISDLVSEKTPETHHRCKQGSDDSANVHQALSSAGCAGFAWANEMSFVERFGSLMVKSAVHIVGFIFPVCIGKGT